MLRAKNDKNFMMKRYTSCTGSSIKLCSHRGINDGCKIEIFGSIDRRLNLLLILTIFCLILYVSLLILTRLSKSFKSSQSQNSDGSKVNLIHRTIVDKRDEEINSRPAWKSEHNRNVVNFRHESMERVQKYVQDHASSVRSSDRMGYV